jgi:hypothetical protein
MVFILTRSGNGNVKYLFERSTNFYLEPRLDRWATNAVVKRVISSPTCQVWLWLNIVGAQFLGPPISAPAMELTLVPTRTMRGKEYL